MIFFERNCTGFLVAVALAMVPVGAQAQTTPEAPTSIEALTGEAAANSSQPIAIEGFRTADFGDDEAAVRAAIESDFGVSGDGVVESQNTAERTRILTVENVEALQGGGPADVSYVLGHTSDTLGQVSVLWSAEGDVDSDQLVANADVLQSYFLEGGYQGDTVVLNVPVPEGLLVFRGSDAQGRMTVLLLRGTLAPGEGAEAGAEGEASPVLTPTSLLLAYLNDPQNPDVFKVEPGQF